MLYVERLQTAHTGPELHTGGMRLSHSPASFRLRRNSHLPYIAMPPLTTATAKVHSADKNQVGAKNGGGMYRWPEFDSRAGVSRLQPYPRLAHASYSLRKATTPKNPVR